MLDLLLITCGCRPSTPGERLLLMGFIRVGLLLGAATLLHDGYTSGEPDADISRGMGYVCLVAGLLVPLIKRAVHNFIDDRF